MLGLSVRKLGGHGVERAATAEKRREGDKTVVAEDKKGSSE